VEDKKKLLILGASGFIGKNLSNFFSKKYKVYGTYLRNKPKLNKKIILKKVNIFNPKQLDRIMKNKDIVINAAAITSGAKDIVHKPYIHFTDNALINSISIRSAFYNNVKNYVCLSCSIIYHNSKKPLKEDDFNVNRKIYDKYFGGAWIKIFAEKSCQFFSRQKKCKYSIIRHTNIYGPHDKFDLHKSHFLGATINKVNSSQNKKLVFWGKGKEMRDFLYIDDLSRAIDKIIKHQKKYLDIVNVSYGKSFKIKDIAKKIIKISKKKLDIIYDISMPNLNINISVNNRYALKKYKWKPLVTIDAGLKKTIKWYKKNA
tara:strand:+ start:9404 stop:10351 length:948 start_codon:yes stop_codon:yes gene_type:complete